MKARLEMASIRIGVNALFLVPGEVGGTEIYLRSLLLALSEIDSVNEYRIFVNRETARDLVPESEKFELVREPIHAAFRPVRIAWEQTGFVVSAGLRMLDVMFNPGFTVPLAVPSPHVTFFHDLQYKHHPELFRWFDLPFWRVLLPLSARRSHSILVPSVETAADVQTFYGIDPKRIRVVEHGVDQAFFSLGGRRSIVGGRKYLLAVSTLHPHKNFELLLRAFGKFRTGNPDIDLVIVGLEGFAADRIKALIGVLDLAAAVTLTGWIPREEVYDYFANAFAFIHPSIFEGFGMSVLEALAAELPSACSGIQPLMRITGKGCVHFDPSSESAILEAIHSVTSDSALRERLASTGPRIARSYSWRRCAEETLDTLLRAARDADSGRRS